jgi:hypothetical protein
MQAIEFETLIHNGVVEIPPQYKAEFDNKTAKVIVLFENPSKQHNKALNTLLSEAKGVLPADYRFDREEANAR